MLCWAKVVRVCFISPDAVQKHGPLIKMQYTSISVGYQYILLPIDLLIDMFFCDLSAVLSKISFQERLVRRFVNCDCDSANV